MRRIHFWHHFAVFSHILESKRPLLSQISTCFLFDAPSDEQQKELKFLIKILDSSVNFTARTQALSPELAYFVEKI